MIPGHTRSTGAWSHALPSNDLEEVRRGRDRATGGREDPRRPGLVGRIPLSTTEGSSGRFGQNLTGSETESLRPDATLTLVQPVHHISRSNFDAFDSTDRSLLSRVGLKGKSYLYHVSFLKNF